VADLAAVPSGARGRAVDRAHPREPAREPARQRDLVDRGFLATAPNRLWVADITDPRAWEGWLHLVAVQDVYLRRIVGWSMADRMRSPNQPASTEPGNSSAAVRPAHLRATVVAAIALPGLITHRHDQATNTTLSRP